METILTYRGAFFFNDTATTEIYTLSLHDALPISRRATATPPPSALSCAVPTVAPLAFLRTARAATGSAAGAAAGTSRTARSARRDMGPPGLEASAPGSNARPRPPPSDHLGGGAEKGTAA